MINKPSFFIRIFSASKVTEETLSKIYKVGLNLEYLSLVECGIRKLPENLFLFLPKVKAVDLRRNLLISLPESLAYHPTLEVLLLSDNLFLDIPPLLHTLPRLERHGLIPRLAGRKLKEQDSKQFMTAVS